MKQTIFLLFVIGMIAATACQKEIEFNVDDRDTIIIKVNGDTNVISVGGDTIVNHLHGGDVNVNGGTTTNTTNVNGGGSGSEQAIVIPAGFQVWKIPAEYLNGCLRYQIADRDAETFFRFTPKAEEIPICFYDAGSDPTTLSFPFHASKHWDKYPNVSVDGKFGSDADKTRKIYCLSVYNTVAEIQEVGTYNNLEWKKIKGNAYLCGIAGNDGNSPDISTGRTLIATNGHSIFLMVAESATTEEAFTTFCNLNLCPSDQIMTVLGGSSSLGKKDIAVTVSIADAIKL